MRPQWGENTRLSAILTHKRQKSIQLYFDWANLSSKVWLSSDTENWKGQSQATTQAEWVKFDNSISVNLSGFSHWFLATTPAHPLNSSSYPGCVSYSNCLELKNQAPLWKHTDLILQNGAEKQAGVHLKQHTETLRWHSVFPIEPPPLRLGTGDDWLYT